MNNVELKKTLDDIWLSLESYLDRTIPSLKALVDQFYGGGSKEAWEQFSLFLGGLEWIFQAFDSMHNAQKNEPIYSEWQQYGQYVSILIERIAELNTALEQGDITLLADLLQFEILPVLEELFRAVRNTVSNEVVL